MLDRRGGRRYGSRSRAEYPSGLRGRIANPLFAGSNPASAFFPLLRQHMKPVAPFALACVCALASFAAGAAGDPSPGDSGAAPFHTAELIFPLEHWHNHGSCVVETPGGDLLVCWFHGSGERTADDVKVEGARLRKGQTGWSPRFTPRRSPRVLLSQSVTTSR